MITATRRRWVALGALVVAGIVLTVLGGAPVVNNSLSVWFVEDDPARVAYERFQELFGNDEVVVLAAGTPGSPLDAGTLDQIAVAAERMRAVEGIASVTGPQDEVPDPLRELLIDDEGSIALLLARFAVMDDVDQRRHDILVSLRDAAQELEGSGTELHWAGIGLVYDELNEISFRETPLLTGASFAIVGVVLFAVVRSLAPVFVALASVVVAILILMGAFTLSGFELNMVTAILPTLLLVVGTANAVHVFTRLRGVPRDSVNAALRDVFRPCLFTALTTAAGFASLATARMAVIRDLGVFAALGVLVAFVSTFVFARAAITTDRLRIGAAGDGWMQRPLEAVVRVVTRRPGRIVAGALGLTALALWAAGNVVVDTYSIEFFREGHPVRVDSDAIEESYGWYLPLEFAVRSTAGEPLATPEVLTAVADWQARVEESGVAAWSLSLADFSGRASLDPTASAVQVPATVRSEGAAAGVGDPRAIDGLPPTQIDPLAAGLLADEGTALRVTFGVPMASARGWSERIEAIRGHAEGVLPEDAVLMPGGYLPLYVRMMEYIVDTQVRSFAAALLVVFTIMAFFLRSARMVLISLFPNLLPIVLIFGVMGVLGIRLDIATVTVAAIVLGIVVDDTVHFLHRFREVLAQTGDPQAGVRAACLQVGPALVGTTVILATSFAVLGLASVLSIALFGLLSAATLVFALVSDLIVLPALLVLFTPPRPPPEGAAASGDIS